MYVCFIRPAVLQLGYFINDILRQQLDVGGGTEKLLQVFRAAGRRGPVGC
jgi:hypothetical protein